MDVIRKMYERLPPRVRVRVGKTYVLGRCRLLAFTNRPIRVILGAGTTKWPGWINTDVDVLDMTNAEDWESLFSSVRPDALLAEHVWEHLHPSEAQQAAKHCYRNLTTDGYVRVAVPDGLHPDETYLQYVRPGGTGPGADDHKILYTFESLSQLFQEAGFHVDMLEHFDDDGIFHFREWDPEQGMIIRSCRFDKRNTGGKLHYTSLVLDAVKKE